jgi:hypothetical protein
MKPNEKGPDVLTKLFSVPRCVPPPIGCGRSALRFRDDVSRREYGISGLCQECQDSVFGVASESR